MEGNSSEKNSSLPPGWHKIHCEYGFYYWNQKTNVTQWKRPTDEGKRKLIVTFKTEEKTINVTPCCAAC